MKKTIIAGAITALLASSAHAVEIFKTEEASVDFYGQMRTQLLYNEADDVVLNAGSSRSGVKASYAVMDGLSVFGLFEFGLSGNGGELDNRLHIAGVDTDFGKLSFGRQYTISDDVYGAEYSYFYGGSGLLYSTLNGAKHTSSIKYEVAADNVWLKAFVGLDQKQKYQELYEVFVGTSVGDLNLHAGYGYNKDEVDGSDTEGLDNEYFEATAEYAIGDGQIGFTYYNGLLTQIDGAAEIQSNGYTLGGLYSINDATGLYAGVEYVDQDLKNIAIDADHSFNIFAGVDYQINKWSKVYAEYAYSDGQTVGFKNKGSGNIAEAQEADKDSYVGIGYRIYW